MSEPVRAVLAQWHESRKRLDARLTVARISFAEDRRNLGRARAIYRRLRAIERRKRRPVLKSGYSLETVMIAGPPLAAGLVVLIVFLPLCVLASSEAHRPLVDVLLMNDVPTNPKGIPLMSGPIARPFLFAFGAIYGTGAVASALIVMSGGLLRLLIVANGMYWGFQLTRLIAVHVLQLMPASAFGSRLFLLKLAYIFLTYYVARSLVVLFSRDDVAKEKYEFAVGGAQGLICGVVLARGFGPAAQLLSGFLFLACAFVCILAMEIAARRAGLFLRSLMRVAGAPDSLLTSFDREKPFELPVVLASFRRAWRENETMLKVGFLIYVLFPVAAWAFGLVALPLIERLL